MGAYYTLHLLAAGADEQEDELLDSFSFNFHILSFGGGGGSRESNKPRPISHVLPKATQHTDGILTKAEVLDSVSKRRRRSSSVNLTLSNVIHSVHENADQDSDPSDRPQRVLV